MHIQNGIEFRCPTSLDQVTLGQRIDFYNQYEKQLISRRAAAVEMKDQTAIDLHDMTTGILEAVYSFSFFTGIPKDTVIEEFTTDELIFHHEAGLKDIIASKGEISTNREFTWKGKVWYIHLDCLTHKSTFTFNELITSKEAIRQLSKEDGGPWIQLQYLCAMFVRQKEEAFEEGMLDESRLKLMRDLSLDKALLVGFFLRNLMSISQQPFQYFENQVAETLSVCQNTSIVGDGSVSSLMLPNRKYSTDPDSIQLKAQNRLKPTQY